MASLLNPLGGALFQKDTAEPMYTSEFEHAHGYGWDYVMVFPTLAFPSDHGITRTSLAKKTVVNLRDLSSRRLR